MVHARHALARGVAAAALVVAACHAGAGEGTSSSTTGDEGSTTHAGSTTTTTGASTTTTDGASTTGPTASASSGTSDASDTSDASASTSDTSTTEGSTDGSTSTTGVEPRTCKKADFLFLFIDGGELWDTEVALKKLMPHLAQRLETEFAGWDWHLMVLDGDAHWGNKYCENACAQGEACEMDPPYPCDYQPSACDQTLGAGVTFSAGGDAPNVPCLIDGDQRYLQSGQQDLAGTLECVRRIGTGYDLPDYQPVQATLDALSDPMNAPGACNEGFLRDDAYLVLFLISPFPDFYTSGTPEAWTQELKAHKGGKFDKIYFIGLFQGCDSSFEWWEFEPMNEWVSSLYHHGLDDACASTVIPYLDPALDYLLSDCQE
ncbi:MAG: hypothetical protein R3B09_01420 [Nannocystaceae bacterium]